jgi:hypothetical protein
VCHGGGDRCHDQIYGTAVKPTPKNARYFGASGFSYWRSV